MHLKMFKLFNGSIRFRNTCNLEKLSCRPEKKKKALHICGLLFTDMSDARETASLWSRVSSELPCQTFINDTYKAEHVRTHTAGHNYLQKISFLLPLSFLTRLSSLLSPPHFVENPGYTFAFEQSIKEKVKRKSQKKLYCCG